MNSQLYMYLLQCGCIIALTGKAWTNNMYVRVVSEGTMIEDFPPDSKESLIPAAPPSATEEPASPPTQPLLVMFVLSTGKTSKQILTREVEIGCVKSNLVKKTSGDFSIDLVQASNPFIKAFTFDIMKVGIWLAIG